MSLLTVGALVVAMCLVLPAGATIVPGRGLGGVNLGMTASEVRAALGPPRTITRTRGALGFLVTRLHYDRLTVDLQTLHRVPVVVRILTTTPGEETRSGIGVGSPIAAAARLPQAHCFNQAPTERYCRIGDAKRPLSRFTLFESTRDRKVTLVEVAFVVNS